MLKKIIKKEGGFTLLELLIVIVIIGILALLIIPNITSAPKKARDTQRKTDMKAIQKGLEEYFVSNNAYPASASATAAETALTALTSGNPAIIKKMPLDPKTASGAATSTAPWQYLYTSDGATYTLHTCLENGSDNGSGVSADAACVASGKKFELHENN